MPQRDFHGTVRSDGEVRSSRTEKFFAGWIKTRRAKERKREREREREKRLSAPLEERDHLGRDDPGESAELTGTLLPS